jgi:HAMP domain-containing protein
MIGVRRERLAVLLLLVFLAVLLLALAGCEMDPLA